MEPARFSLRIHPIIMKKMKIIADVSACASTPLL